ncbi:MAG: FkbM family methyltransferase [Gammaproteobacteria bacterium]
MSRTFARLITATVRTLVAPLSARQRQRVLARVIAELRRDEAVTIETPRGTLKFLQARGAFAASAIARFHSDEPETLAWIDGFAPGEVLWDIGANIGLYALYAGLDPTRRVFAFEPSAFNFGVLAEHIALNRMDDRVRPLCIALGAHGGLGELCMRHTDPGHGSNALNVAANNFGPFEPTFRQAIPAYTIDGFRATFDLPPPAHLKLDVDGIELDIVRGAERTLPHVNSLLVEVEGATGAAGVDELTARLAAAGLVEDPAIRAQGSCRNRLYRRA